MERSERIERLVRLSAAAKRAREAAEDATQARDAEIVFADAEWGIGHIREIARHTGLSPTTVMRICGRAAAGGQ